MNDTIENFEDNNQNEVKKQPWKKHFGEIGQRGNTAEKTLDSGLGPNASVRMKTEKSGCTS